MEEEVVYAGISLRDCERWWRYADGTLEPLPVAAGAGPQDVALAILHDFATRDPVAVHADAAAALAQAFAGQFLIGEDGVQACFVEGHRIRTWVAVQRMCGRV